MTNGEIGKSRVQQERAARAGAALRENLKRRKEQARGRKAQDAGEGQAKSHDSAGFVPDKPKA
ncbi:MAG: hypothetical protein AB1490_28815 [Pseudomonadota bacterium]